MKTLDFEKWDMHHHIIPDFYVDELKSVGVTDIFDFKQPKWNEAMQQRMMKKHNIKKAFMSISTPGVFFNGKEFSRRLARKCNEYIARMIAKNPDKLGGFASLPLPDVEGAIIELKYSLDDLRLDGIGLLSNVEGKYLGCKDYETFFKELNDRHATIFIHPTAPPNKMEHKLLNYMYLFMLDTTRTLIDFIRSGYHKKFSNIKFILSHGGGVLPAVYPTLVKSLKERIPNIETELEQWRKQIYLDTARIAYHDTMAAAISFAGINHLVLGTDYIWAKRNYSYWLKLISTLNIEKELIQDIFKNNAENAINSREAMDRVIMPNIPAANKRDKTNIHTKFHYHCMPEKVVRMIKNMKFPINENKLEKWDINRTLRWMDENYYKRTLLSFDFPGIWDADKDDIASILRLFNNEVSEIVRGNSERIGAFGAVDTDNVEHALEEIDYCLNDLKLDGICIYIKLYTSEMEKIVDIRLLEKLKVFKVPVLIHPKDSTGIPIENEYYLDSVYFIAKMMYLGNFKYLKESEYILTHTGGIISFMAQNLGLLYYLQFDKKKVGKFLFDWLIKKKLVGYEFLNNIQIDD